MTEEDLTDIEARANAASEGPWALASPGIGTDLRDAKGRVVANQVIGGGFTSQEAKDREVATAVFLAAARSDVPALVAEVRRLREGILRKQWGAVVDYDNFCPWCWKNSALGEHAQDCFVRTLEDPP